MWHLMVFEDTTKTTILKVMTFETVNDVSYVVGLPAKTIYNYFHHLILPRGPLRYVSLFKD